MTAPKDITLANALVVTDADQLSTAVTLGSERTFGRFFGKYTCDVSDITPGATLSVVLETADSASGYAPLVTLAPFTAPGAQDVAAIGCKKFVRAHFGISGVSGASATVTFTGTSFLSYCTNKDITTLALPPQAVAGVPEIDKAEACLAATDEAVSYLGKFFDLPVVAWGGALRLHVANMAAYHLMKRRGFSPDNDPLIRAGYTDALAWLSKNAENDSEIEDNTPTVAPNSAYMVSNPPRGWYD